MSKQDIILRLKKRLAKRPTDDFTLNVVEALQHLDQSSHGNSESAVQCLESCVDCYERKDPTAARLLLWVSGALITDSLCAATWHSIAQAASSAVVARN
jgi:hypothetical protein